MAEGTLISLAASEARLHYALPNPYQQPDGSGSGGNGGSSSSTSRPATTSVRTSTTSSRATTTSAVRTTTTTSARTTTTSASGAVQQKYGQCGVSTLSTSHSSLTTHILTRILGPHLDRPNCLRFRHHLCQEQRLLLPVLVECLSRCDDLNGCCRGLELPRVKQLYGAICYEPQTFAIIQVPAVKIIKLPLLDQTSASSRADLLFRYMQASSTFHEIECFPNSSSVHK